jgi:acyl-CoA synthetase (AMP-forming)/AMP-acid ligase II
VLTDVIERERITHLAAVGSTLALLAQHTNGFHGRDVTALRRVMTGAEVLDPRAVQAWLAAAPDLVVINGYGPTEATCLVVAHPIGEREPDRTEPYPIGRPLAGVRIGFLRDDGVIDEHGPGEILVAGAQVMTGYLNRPEENAFQDVDGVRFYRTGDRGCRRDDGVLLFHGRHDDEVKVRGYRVNLNEVRRAVETHPDVGRAFVALVTDHRGAAVLSCAIAGKAAPAVPAGDGPELAPAALAASVRAHLAARLPGYMVPVAFHELSSVPTLPSGKPDTASILASLRAADTAPAPRR